MCCVLDNWRLDYHNALSVGPLVRQVSFNSFATVKCLLCTYIVVILTYLFICNSIILLKNQYRHTSEILRVWFQTTAIKQILQ
uniref:Uncharacterized protein n=1 Tax=Apteryx owenii TaxID=8824 RepID=A0A8B9P1L6_APTOW